MNCIVRGCAFIAFVLSAFICPAQSGNYQVITVENGGTIRGRVTWNGPLPHLLPSEINKDPQICDPQGAKRRDLERLLVAPGGGVANTVVYLANISRGKAMDLPQVRRNLNQKNCRYEPHILLVPLGSDLQVKSSDATLHTVHMSGAADFNLPFTAPGQTAKRTMNREGEVSLRCNAGHVWMNGEMIVAPHPYYVITDEDGEFALTQVPPGDYEIVAWHEGWRVVGESQSYDLGTQVRVQRPVFSDPVIWSKRVSVPANGSAEVTFTLGEHTQQVLAGR